MTSNTTNGLENFPMYMLYTAQGLIISGGNLLIALSIIRYEALRTNKEYLVMLSLSLADSCNLSGFLVAGVHRTYLLFIGHHQDLLSSWQCATKPHNLILTCGSAWSNLMLTLVSLDRLFSVTMPLRYLGWSYKYAYGILFPSFVFGLLNTGMYLYVGYMIPDDADKVLAPCVTNAIMKHAPDFLAFIFQAIPSTCAFSSVIIYLAVWYKHKKHFSQIAPSSGSAGQSEQNQQLKHQRRVTVSLGMSCICTFILFCVPMMAANALLWYGHETVPLIFYLLSTFNPLCNIFIYQIRHKELRMALKGLISCKHLPIDVRMWNVNQNAQNK